MTIVRRAWLLSAVLAFASSSSPRSAAQDIPELPIPDLELRPHDEAGVEARPVGTSEVRVSEVMTVDIIVQNDSITNVLNKLAVQARYNIVPSRHVGGIVNATIYDVPFYDALEGLLHPNGLGYVERGDFIFVYTNEELAELGLGNWRQVTEIVHLDYVRPEDARDFVLNMLSESGHIEISKDAAPEDEGGDAAGAVTSGLGAYGGGVSAAGQGDEVYTPDEDKYALASTIIVQDYQENVDRIVSFLREIDTQPAQVLIEATIIQTSLSEANAFGVDFAVLTDNAFVDFFNNPIGGVPIGVKTITDPDTMTEGPIELPNNSGVVISNPGQVGTGASTIRGGYMGDDVGVFIRALDQVEDVTLLSNPKILTLNRQRAKVFVGERIGYLQTTVAENQVNQGVSFIDTGIVLDIRPFILRDGRIRLELSPKVSSVEFRDRAANGMITEVPNELIQTVSTDVLVPEGYTAVIGGLFRDENTRSRSQVPVLGDIPVVGAAFQGHDDSVKQLEVIFLIKPTVLENRVLVEQGGRATEYEDRVRVGSRMGLLPWSRERQTARLNLEAQRLLLEGQSDKALHKIRRSLELHPVQPEVLRMRERLVNEPAWWPTRSYLDRVIYGEFEDLDRPAAPFVEEPPLGGQPAAPVDGTQTPE